MQHAIAGAAPVLSADAGLPSTGHSGAEPVPVSEAPDGGLTMDFVDPDGNGLSLYQPAGAPRRK